MSIIQRKPWNDITEHVVTFHLLNLVWTFMFSFRSSLHYDVSLLPLKSTKFWGFTQPMLQCHKSHCKTTLPNEKRNICRSAPTCVILMNLCPILHINAKNNYKIMLEIDKFRDVTSAGDGRCKVDKVQNTLWWHLWILLKAVLLEPRYPALDSYNT